MTKFIHIVAALLLLGTDVYADIIHTQQGESIEAKVMEIGLETIKYRRLDNIDGPLYVIDKASVTAIDYDNGQHESFATTISNNVSTPEPASPYTGERIKFSQRYGFTLASGDSIGEGDYLLLTQQQCIEANKLYLKGERLRRTGKWFLAVGLPSTLIGTGLFVGFNKNANQKAPRNVGVVLMGIGGAALATGIPLYCVGIHQKKQSVQTYNSHLSFNVYPNSLAIALNF